MPVQERKSELAEGSLSNAARLYCSVGVELEDVPYLRADFKQTVIAPGEKALVSKFILLVRCRIPFSNAREPVPFSLRRGLTRILDIPRKPPAVAM